MLPNVLNSNGNAYSTMSHVEYDNGQNWGNKLAEEFYHTISPDETDFARPAQKVLHQYFNMSQLRTKSNIWFDEYYKGFQAYCTKMNEAFFSHAAPAEEEFQNDGQDLRSQKIKETEYILNFLNTPHADIAASEESYWEFILGTPLFEMEKSNSDNESATMVKLS
ncbi:MAG: hypothetical protein KDJ52_30035 [Anaerolineae bacterium]|nr:hypothetical protein [Anaerolineae bacterium]